MCSICLDASYFSCSDSLVCPPTGHSWPLPPIQMQKLPSQQAGKQQVHTYPLYSSTEGLQVRPEKQLQKYGRLAVPKAVPPLRTGWRLSSLGQLITIFLSVLVSPLTIGGHSLSFFSCFHLLSSSVLSNPKAWSHAWHPAPSTHFHWLVRAFSALTADEVLQMKLYSCACNHSPHTTATPDTISTTVLSISRSEA